MAMAGATPKHLYAIGLLDKLVEDEELDINFLMSQALITVSTLPFHMVNDLWRWKVFQGEVIYFILCWLPSNNYRRIMGSKFNI